MTERLWVAGDGFPTPGLHPEVRTYREVLHALRTGGLDRAHLEPALGVGPQDWGHLERVVSGRGATDEVTLAPPPPPPLPRAEVLKKAQENVVLAAPRVDGDTVEYDLVVCDGNEIMRDHTAERQHLPGMLLIEAGIQATTWATRRSCPADGGHLPYPVMHECAFAFARFLFWLPVTVRVTLAPTGPAVPGRRPLRAEVVYTQHGRDAATGRFSFHAFHPPVIHGIEHDQSRKLIDEALTRGRPAAH